MLQPESNQSWWPCIILALPVSVNSKEEDQSARWENAVGVIKFSKWVETPPSIKIMDCEGDDDGSDVEWNQSRSESFAKDDDEDDDILRRSF